MNNKFTIGKETKVFLYGAASIGKIVFENLSAYGIRISGFIDKRANELPSFLQQPVYSFEEFCKNDRDAVVIISVKNVFEHYQIAERFIRESFHNLVYMPQEVLNGEADPEQIEIGNVFNSVVDGKIASLENIPASFKLYSYHFAEYPVISENGDKVLAYIPASFIFTNDYDPQKQKWGNVNILSFFTHLNFFDFLLGKSDSNIDDYVQEYCVYTASMQGDIVQTDAWKQNVVRNRTMIFHRMNRAFDLDPEFFLRSPAQARWNDRRKYFNLTAGKHRVLFQCCKGRYFIPLLIDRSDYEKFVNRDAVLGRTDLLKKAGATRKYTIDNPFFYLYPMNSYDENYIVMKRLSKYFAKEIYARYDRVDYSKCSFTIGEKAFFDAARLFARMGASVDYVEPNDIERATMEIEQVSFVNDPRKDISVLIGRNAADCGRYDYIVSSGDSPDESLFEEDLSFTLMLGETTSIIRLFRRKK